MIKVLMQLFSSMSKSFQSSKSHQHLIKLIRWNLLIKTSYETELNQSESSNECDMWVGVYHHTSFDERDIDRESVCWVSYVCC